MNFDKINIYLYNLYRKGDTMKRITNILFKIISIVLIVFLSSSYISKKEHKIYSVNKNRTVDLSTMALKTEEFIEDDIYSVKDTFTGDLTGYIYNCPLCNGTLGCKRSYDITDGKTTYPDKEYGEVRIVASSFNLPCGSIIRFNSSRISDEPTIAIVLDRGVLGNSIDLLSENYDYAIKLGRSVITYDVLRKGWGE